MGNGRPEVSLNLLGVASRPSVRTTMLFKGYTDPALNTEAFDDEGWFRTGDLGVVREDGHVKVTGRVTGEGPHCSQG